MDIDSLRRIIQDFSFDRCPNGNRGFEQILIQLFGFMGHGKSSFINSCMYVWEDGGEYQSYATVSDESGGSTLRRITYQLTKNISLVDNRGFSTLDGYETGEIFAQLGNLLPLNDDVRWTKKYELLERMAQSQTSVRTSDFIVPVFVYSVLKSLEPEELSEVKATLVLAQQLTGIFPIVVLTHKASGTLTERMNEFRNMGVDRIFTFENYTCEDHFKTRGRHEEVLRFLHDIIQEAKFRVDQPRDPEGEMRKRRKFVITYVREREKIMRHWELDRKKYTEQTRAEKHKGQPQPQTQPQTQPQPSLQERKLKKRRDTGGACPSMRSLSLQETPIKYGLKTTSLRDNSDSRN